MLKVSNNLKYLEYKAYRETVRLMNNYGIPVENDFIRWNIFNKVKYHIANNSYDSIMPEIIEKLIESSLKIEAIQQNI